MEYRKLPKGNENEKFSVIGLGMGGIQHTPPEEIEAIIKKVLSSTTILTKYTDILETLEGSFQTNMSILPSTILGL